MKRNLLLLLKRFSLLGIFFLFAMNALAYTPPTALRVLWVEGGGVPAADSHLYGDYITNVTFAGINNTTAGSGTKAWHTDFGRSPQIAEGNVTIGQTYSFSVTLASTDYTFHYVAVYVDWNQNNTNGTTGFPATLDTNENPLVWNGLSGSGSKTLTGTITVPTGINPGQIYLRVMIDCDSQNPAAGDYTCAVGFGELQDYVLNVSAPAAIPTVTGISPTSGTITGGTSVVISGTNFTSTATVKFGSTSSSSVTFNSATSLTAIAPAGSAGAVDVTVTTTGGTSAISGSDQFTYIAAPTVTGSAASSITTTTATLNGTVNAQNASTAVTFDYGLTTSYGTSVTATQSPVTGTTATAVTIALSGLVPNTTYHYRVNGVNTAGTTNGTDLTFTTTAAVPTSTTSAASSITTTGATLNGSVNANNASTAVTFDYGLTTSYGTSVTATQSPVTGTTATAVSYVLSGLVPNTTYHYRVNGVNTAGTTNGTDLTFTTTAAVPTSTTSAASSITTTGATLNGTVNAQNASTAVTFDYGLTTSYGTSVTATQSPVTGTTATAVTIALSGLVPNTTYHYRVNGVNTAGTTNGTDLTFTTTAAVPTSTTSAASSITTTGATLNGSVNANNASTAVTFDYGLTTSYGTSVTATQSPVTGTTATAVSYVLSGLVPNTAYHYRVKGVNTAGTTNGTDLTFTTTPAVPVVIAISPTSGPTTGGTTVIITGTNLLAGLAVKFGSTIATNYTVNSATLIIATSPAGSAGVVDVTVTTMGGTSVTTGSDQFTYVTVSDAPTIGAATAGNAQASVAFTAPTSNGGSAITNYTVTSSPGGLTGTGTSSPITVTGLTNGTAYTFTVTATNGVGTSSASSASLAVTPVTVSDAPTMETATAGNAQASIAFTAPTSNGGSAITGYTVTSSPGGLTGTGTSSPITVTGLTNGTAYTFTVTATNGVGISSASSASLAVTPVTVSDAPTIGTATAGDTQASINFTAPTFNGGSAITGYTVTSSSGSFTGTGTGSPITVTGLTNGTAYTFTVTATNGVGTSSASTASNSVTPNKTQTITFDNPGTQTFGTLPTLVATATSGVSVTFSTTTPDVCSITSDGILTFKKAGSCTILADQAGNEVYTAAPTVSQTFTVNAVTPGAPVIGTVTSGDGVASVSFTAPSSNGGADVTYTVTSSPGNFAGTGTTSPITVTGLANGTSYTFTVTAANIAGTSIASAASNSVIAYSAPVVTTDAASDITSSGAMLKGTVSANGASTTVTFEYGTTVAYGTSVTATQSPVTEIAGIAVSKIITGLISNTTYHYRVVGVNTGGTTNGSDQTFTTDLNTGLDNAAATVFSLYPNPTSEGFYIHVGDVTTLLSICDLSGRTVLTQQVTDNSYVNINPLQNGVYVVKVNGMVAKLVKK